VLESFSANRKLHFSWPSTVEVLQCWLYKADSSLKKNWPRLSCLKKCSKFEEAEFALLGSDEFTTNTSTSQMNPINFHTRYCIRIFSYIILTLSTYTSRKRSLPFAYMLRVPPISFSFTWFHLTSEEIFELVIINFPSVCYYFHCLSFRYSPPQPLLEPTKFPLRRIIKGDSERTHVSLRPIIA
jgi:hypothetical protein